MGATITNTDERAFDVESHERVLFVFTHPDDEVSVAAFIWRLQREGVPIHIVWTHSTPVREAESRTAMSKIGVDHGLLSFLGGKDGCTVDEIPRLRDEIAKIVSEFRPTRVITHAFEQGHLDHDTTNLLVHLTFDGPTFEAPFYHTYLTRFPVIYRFSSPESEQIHDLTEQDIAKKRELLDCYPSQTIKRNMILYDLARKLGLRKDDLFENERMRLQTHYDYKRPNHPAETAMKIEASEAWKRWIRAVDSVV